ncbi:MAG TPA: MFS transporter [Vicinamibacterales bacterium]|jgi:MFS family permease|nr:MFS transporter [Vicinamibacterales bacterium]
MLQALRSRNYRLFFGGQIVSLAGTWITMTATSWLVYRLTGSALLLGLVGFAGQFPAFLLGPFAGIFVDRWDRRRLLVWTQTVSMLQSFALAALTLGGQVTVEAILFLNVIQGIVNAFDMPGRQSFLIALIDNKADLGNAIALNSSMVNVARLLGPSIAGLVIAATNEGWCFLIDGFSYLGVIAALLAMRIEPRPAPTHKRPGGLEQFVEGWTYAFGFRPIRSIILLLALVSLVGVPYSVLMPIFATTIFRGGPHTLGFLMTSSGCGALAGALWLAQRRSVIGLGRLIVIASASFGAGLIGFSFARTLWLAIPCLVVAGFGFMVQMAASNTIIQTIVDDEKRGRVMSFYTMAFLGTAPFGSLIAGWMSARLGAPHTLFVGGVGCLAGAAWFAAELPAVRRAVRPIYVSLGILPQVAVGLSNASELSVPPEPQ